MPFAGYKNFADCVAKNRDKGNAQAYCGAIKHQVEGKKTKRSTRRANPRRNRVRGKKQIYYKGKKIYG